MSGNEYITKELKEQVLALDPSLKGNNFMCPILLILDSNLQAIVEAAAKVCKLKNDDKKALECPEKNSINCWECFIKDMKTLGK